VSNQIVKMGHEENFSITKEGYELYQHLIAASWQLNHLSVSRLPKPA
jgi:hypothetical protein